MLELRILSGYHRGATLPLGEERLCLGADDDADVVLADPGIAPRHATLHNPGGGWMLIADQGEIRGAQSNAVTQEIAMQEDGFARAGAIWLAVREVGTAWQDPPPDPRDEPAAAGESAASQGGNRPERNEEQDAADASEAQEEELFNAREEMETAGAEGPVPAAAPRRSRGLRMLMVPATVAAVLSAAAAYALTGQPGQPGEVIAAREADQVRRLAGSPQQLTQDELRSALRKRLEQVDLLHRVTLDLEPGGWTIRGALGDDDAERLQRMLRKFSQAYVIDFPINVKIGSDESMLPFRISQVVSGSDPSIVTEDGHRLYVGDEYRGARLAAVAGNRLKFTGKHDLNVTW